MLRCLTLWLMMCVLPLQAFAMGSGDPCAMAHAKTTNTEDMLMTQSVAYSMPNAMAQHDHVAMQVHDDHATQHHAPGHDAMGKCSPCCSGAMVSASLAPLTLPEGAAVLVAAPLATLTSVTLDYPQRPPTPVFVRT